MKKNYNIPAEILDTPYDDWEQPNIRFDVKLLFRYVIEVFLEKFFFLDWFTIFIIG